MKRYSYIFVIVLILSIVLSSCQPVATTPATIKIGVNAELTGGVPVVGESCKNAADLAVKEINDAGGLK
jgi:branched-chain amino acid transport system substrate-binding protein